MIAMMKLLKISILALWIVVMDCRESNWDGAFDSDVDILTLYAVLTEEVRQIVQQILRTLLIKFDSRS